MTHPETFEPIAYDDIERVGIIVKVKGTDQLFAFGLTEKQDVFFREMAEKMGLGLAILPTSLSREFILNPQFEPEREDAKNPYECLLQYFESDQYVIDTEWAEYLHKARKAFLTARKATP